MRILVCLCVTTITVTAMVCVTVIDCARIRAAVEMTSGRAVIVVPSPEQPTEKGARL